jgi:hypothetical protein
MTAAWRTVAQQAAVGLALVALVLAGSWATARPDRAIHSTVDGYEQGYRDGLAVCGIH